MIQKTIQYLAVCSISLAMAGILVHDTKWDKAVTMAMPIAVAIGLTAYAVEFGDNAHTHSERGSLNKAAASGLPRVLPPNSRRRFIAQRNSQHGNDIGMGGIIWPNAA